MPDTGLSPFESLIAPVFVLTCSYLRLDKKCYQLPVLSKSVNRAFDRTKCCRDFIQFDVLDSDAAQQLKVNLKHANEWRTAVIGYVQHASRIRTRIYTGDLPPKRRQNILLSIRKALVAGNLNRLFLEEGCFAILQPSITSEILTHLNQPKVQMRDLHIKLIDTFGIHKPRPTGYFNALKQCTTLIQLFIDVERDPSLDTHLIPHLPKSIEDLVVISSMRDDKKLPVWTKAFSNNSFLPVLRRFAVRKYYDDFMQIPLLQFAPVLTSTIMKQTDALRPICTWFDYDINEFAIMNKLPITEITCTSVTPKAAKSLSIDIDLFSSLRSLFISAFDKPANATSLISLASRRQLEEFSFASQCEQYDETFDDTLAKATANMSHLRFLSLRHAYTPVFQSKNLSALIPADSWPQLESMTIRGTKIPGQQLLALVAAAPRCRFIAVKVETSSVTSLLFAAMVLHHCPDAVRIHFDVTKVILESMQSARDAFMRFPGTTASMQSLVELSLPSFDAPVAVFHYFLQHFVDAPHLLFGGFGLPAYSALALCCVRSLKHLRSLNDFTNETVGTIDVPEYRKAKVLKLLTPYQPAGDLINSHTFDDELYHEQTLDRQVRNFEEVVQRVNQKCGHFPHPVIDKKVYDAVFEVLSEKDKARLRAWDAGDYRVQ